MHVCTPIIFCYLNLLFCLFRKFRSFSSYAFLCGLLQSCLLFFHDLLWNFNSIIFVFFSINFFFFFAFFSLKNNQFNLINVSCFCLCLKCWIFIILLVFFHCAHLKPEICHFSTQIYVLYISDMVDSPLLLIFFRYISIIIYSFPTTIFFSQH